MNFRIGVMLGRLSDGFQSDHGKRAHAVVRRMVTDVSRRTGEKITVERSVALCGARPGRRSVGWDFENYSDYLKTEVTCPRCVEKLVKQALKAKNIMLPDTHGEEPLHITIREAVEEQVRSGERRVTMLGDYSDSKGES